MEMSEQTGLICSNLKSLLCTLLTVLMYILYIIFSIAITNMCTYICIYTVKYIVVQYFILSKRENFAQSFDLQMHFPKKKTITHIVNSL